jgi:hypothetical protein
MDDWSLLPRRNAVSEPAPDPQSPMTTTALHARLTQPRQAPPAGADHPRSQRTALDPAGLARQPRHQSGAQPQNPNDPGHTALPTAVHTPARQHRTTTALTTRGPSWMTQDVCFARSGALSAARRPATRRQNRATSATPGRFGSLAVAMRALRLDRTGRLSDRAVSAPRCLLHPSVLANRRGLDRRRVRAGTACGDEQGAHASPGADLLCFRGGTVGMGPAVLTMPASLASLPVV